MIDLKQARTLEKEAADNGGHCTHCSQTIKIYQYGISTSMLKVLRSMARASRMGGDIIAVDKLGLKYSERTQLTKLRFHGLVAKVKKDGNQLQRQWVVTTKGWQFIGGAEIPAKAVVYNNQVLGHDGGTTTIRRVGGLAGDFEEQPVTEAESRTYAAVRKPQYDKTVQAEYMGASAGEFVRGHTYELKMTRLQVSQPLHIMTPLDSEMQYNDIAAFKRDWKVTA